MTSGAVHSKSKNSVLFAKTDSVGIRQSQRHLRPLTNLLSTTPHYDIEQSYNFKSWFLSPRHIMDLELLLNGSYSPLSGFVGQADYVSILENMRLEDGTLWPIPITLDVDPTFAESSKIGETVALRDAEGTLLANLKIESIWSADKALEALALYGTKEKSHPGVKSIFERRNTYYLGGKISGISPPAHIDFQYLRNSPSTLRNQFNYWRWENVAAYHTHDIIQKAGLDILLKAARRIDAGLLINPSFTTIDPLDRLHIARARSFIHLSNHFGNERIALNFIEYATRNTESRDGLMQAIIHANFGCTHFIPLDFLGNPQYKTDERTKKDANELLKRHSDELGLEILEPDPTTKIIYPYDESDLEIPSDNPALQNEIVTRTKSQNPDELKKPEISSELRNLHSPRIKQGFTIFMTGFSGAGKSTIANALALKLMEIGGRKVTLLDGDIVRKLLSSELGFSKEHRILNILRIGYVASEVTKHGGIAVCATIAPYAAARKQIRENINKYGGFIEIHISTPIEVCERRDRKGLYAKARKGVIKEFTGISDPYEVPENPDLCIDTSQCDATSAVDRITDLLNSMGYLNYGD